MRWTVVIPAKALPAAKSRLAGASTDAAAHARLVLALRSDTLAAAKTAPGVARVLLVTDVPAAAPEGIEVLIQSQPGLNAALEEGARHARTTWPADSVAALLGDLPALRPEELGAALRAAGSVERGYVPDASGTGTTLLTARAGTELLPRFGPGSAARHAAVATPLPGGPGLRRDVDTLEDLRAALELGVGPATLAAVASAPVGPSTRIQPQPSVVHLGGR